MIGVLTAWHVLIIIGLISIGVYRLALIPATILIVLLGYMISSRQFDSRKEEGQYLLRQVAFLGAWSLFIVGSWSFGDIIGDQNYWGIGLVGVQILGRLTAIIRKKYEATKFFHRGYYLSSVLVFIGIGGDIAGGELIQLIASRGRLTIGLYAFIAFVIGSLGYAYNSSLKKLIFVYMLVELIYFILFLLGSNRMIGVLLGMFVLLLIIWYFHEFQQTATRYIPTRDEDQEDFYELLYGVPVTPKPIQGSGWLAFINPIGQRMYDNKKLVIMSLAVSMTILLVGTMLRVAGGLSAIQLISMYAILFTYCGGWIITRQWSDEWHRGRRITLLGVMIVLYFTVIQWFGNETISLLIASVPISICMSLFLLYETTRMRQPLFDMADRRARLSGIVMLIVLVSILFFRLPFSNQLIFALLCMYLGIQGMIVWYTWRSLE